jgi:uncharacterized membrane protein YkoI
MSTRIPSRPNTAALSSAAGARASARRRLALSALAGGLLCGAAWLAAPRAQAAEPAALAAVVARATVPLAEAIDGVEKNAPGRVTQAELEDDRTDAQGAPLYEMELATPQAQREDLLVSAATGQIVGRKADGPLKAKDAERLKAATLPLSQSVRTALGRQPGHAVQAELDSHFGTVVHEVDILTAQGTLVQVKVHAGNGQIVSVRGK